jgi:hypothetical protein
LPSDTFALQFSSLPERRAVGSERTTPTDGIDKSQLPHPEPRRVRDKEHVKFVAQRPCLICGRRPADAHHLRFTQPRALGRKVSDEFTVPLCRGHHREVLAVAMKPHGGKMLALIRPSLPGACGWRRIRCQRVWMKWASPARLL